MRGIHIRGRTGVFVAAMTALTLGVTGTGISYAAGAFDSGTLGDNTVGAQPDGSYLTQTGQFVTPAGEVITENGRPFGLALNPSGQTAASLNTGGGTTGVVTVFDLVNHKVLQQTGSGGISNGGILYSPDGTHLWIAQTSDLLDYTVAADGTLSNPVKVALPGVNGRRAVPAGLAWAPNGDLLVTLSADNSLGMVDPATHTVVSQIPVGNVPDSVVVIGGMAYVSNQGGRPATSGDQTDLSYGTPIVTNNPDQVPATGTVSEVDLSTGTQVRTFDVGLEPSALLADGTNLLVANSDSDTVTTIDTARQQAGRTFSADPAPGSPYGAQPNGLVMLDATHLAVSLGRYNTVAVYGYHGAYVPPSFQGLIPTGSFPSGLAVDPQLGNDLLVASEQGVGSLGPDGTVNEGVGTNPATSHLGYNFAGTLQLVAHPTGQRMRQWTQQVFRNNQWDGLLARNARAPIGNRARPVAVPLHIGDPSLIKHVFLIVRENRTYDQVLGDVARGNGDPALTQFGQRVTPNAHALVRQFPLIDNLYSDGTNSAEGHNWLDQAFVNNYMQQMYGNYTRSYAYDGGDPLVNNPTGFIWDDALKHGKTVTDWGEYANGYARVTGSTAPAINWQKFYADSQVLEGKASGPLNYPIGSYQPTTDIPSLAKILQPNFPNFNLSIPDQYRADLFKMDFSKYVANRNLPALNLMWLTDDHTDGTSPGNLAPQAEVADNDLALGRVVDMISHSPYWKSTAIFVVEDDSQNGVDHVDGHRNVAMVISPYAKHGYVDHTYYSQLNIIRTIEQILGIPPMNAEDLAAEPMFNTFTNVPDFTPYHVVPSNIPLTETNPTVATITNPAQKAWALWSAKQNFKTEDMVSMNAENRDIWYSTTGWKIPYPGDTKVLLPSQVPGGSAPPAGADS